MLCLQVEQSRIGGAVWHLLSFPFDSMASRFAQNITLTEIEVTNGHINVSKFGFSGFIGDFS